MNEFPGNYVAKSFGGENVKNNKPQFTNETNYFNSFSNHKICSFIILKEEMKNIKLEKTGADVQTELPPSEFCCLLVAQGSPAFKGTLFTTPLEHLLRSR